jgi:hypothetical protein
MGDTLPVAEQMPPDTFVGPHFPCFAFFQSPEIVRRIASIKALRQARQMEWAAVHRLLWLEWQNLSHEKKEEDYV